MDKSLDAISKVILGALREDFDNVEISDVKVDRDVDYDDDDVLRVTVVFEGTPKNIDSRMISGAVRNIRPKLAEIGEHAFPLFSFVSRRDTGAKVGGPA